jgi:hypothetical protein
MYPQIFIVLSLLFAQLTSSRFAPTAAEPLVTDSQVSYTFAGQVEFQAQIQSELPINEVTVFIRNGGEENTFVGDAVVNQGEATYVHDLTLQPLRAFSEIEYWYAIKTPDNVLQESKIFTFFYEDNRFDWQVLKDTPFRVHWYEGDLDFARSVLDSAQQGLDKSETLLNLTAPDQIDIYVYASGLEMQSTLRLAGLDWIAGHADPDLNVMVVTLPPGPDQTLETDRQIPHELNHILLYRAIPAGYNYLPVWFNEGLASINELRPNPDYYIILNSAIEKDELIPISELCESFPTDASGIYLAYAQADSFTRYLNRQYGSAGLQNLVNNYSTGLDCKRGAELGLGVTLEQLDQKWKADISGRTTSESAVSNLLPWVFLLVLVLGMLASLSIMYLIRNKNVNPVLDNRDII